MFFRIVLTSLFTMLIITPLQADWKKTTISHAGYAGKRVVDSENEENGVEPVEGNTILYAKARIAAEHDSAREWQIPGTEFKAFGRIRGIAPNDDYNGYWFISLTAWNDRLDIPELGVNKWEGDYEYENEEKDKDNFTKLNPLADFLSRCTATASITGGDRLQYWSEEYFYGQSPQEPDRAHAYADDFSHADADEWECYNCTTPNDELDTPCSKCGGEDRQGGILIENLIPTPTPAPDPTPDTDDEDTNNDGAINTPTPGLSPADGSSNPTASPGDTHEAKVITSEPYYYVYWYVLGPGESLENASSVETDEGWQSGGTETEASLSYTFASDASTGVYTIVAVSQRYSDLSQGSTRSYTITVE